MFIWMFLQLLSLCNIVFVQIKRKASNRIGSILASVNLWKLFKPNKSKGLLIFLEVKILGGLNKLVIRAQFRISYIGYWTPERRNTEHRRNSRTPRNSGRTTEHYPEHQRNTAEYQRNTNVTAVKYPGTTEPYKTKNNCSIFKRKFKTQKLNFQLKAETLFIAEINYLFIYFSLFKVGLQAVKLIIVFFLTNK